MSGFRSSIGFQVAAAVIGWLVCLPITLSISGCKHQESQAARIESEQMIRDLDALWSQSADQRDVDRTMSFYSPDAVSQLPNASTVASGIAIRSSWAQFLGHAQSVTWHVDKVQVADSDDLAYGTGVWTATTWSHDRLLETSHGKLLEVWRKKTGESWKAVAANYNLDEMGPWAGGRS